MKDLPTTEERIWAVLAHLSAIALGMGIVLPVIGWSEQRRKSKYASFQCLQALGYQSLGYTVWLLGYFVLTIILLIALVAFVAAAGSNGAGTDAMTGVWVSIFLVVLFGSFGLYLLFPVIAAIACALGRDFHYPMMGKRLARYVGYEAAQSNDEQVGLIEDHEDRWVVAMGHFSVIIILWGMLAPLTAWIMQGKRSVFLKFQSMQTLAYQIIVTLLFFAAGFVYMFGFVGLGLAGANGLNEGTGISGLSLFGLALFGIAMLVAFGIVLIVPLFHIMGQWAGYRMLKGDDYRYPIVGKLVEKWQRSSEDKSLTKP